MRTWRDRQVWDCERCGYVNPEDAKKCLTCKRPIDPAPGWDIPAHDVKEGA